ncbi:MAG TPA: hypothetical protein VK927_04335 [Adhaeribacter sp.]|nr:hypothetical protein [Adhaeribacter sp.]
MLLLIIGGAAYWQDQNPTRNLASESADLSITAPELFRQFSENEAQANARYLDKVIMVRGNLKAIGRAPKGALNLTLEADDLMGGVTCEIPAENVPKGLSLEVGEPVIIKGQCTGYLTDVVLVKCVIAG